MIMALRGMDRSMDGWRRGGDDGGWKGQAWSCTAGGFTPFQGLDDVAFSCQGARILDREL